MKAGRELDVKIGDEFFDMVFWYGDPTGFNIEENRDYWIVGSENDYGELSKRCPFFTTRIADAWLVVEKLPTPYTIGRYNGEWIVTIARDDDTKQGRADTAPLAICLAALKAVE